MQAEGSGSAKAVLPSCGSSWVAGITSRQICVTGGAAMGQPPALTTGFSLRSLWPSRRGSRGTPTGRAEIRQGEQKRGRAEVRARQSGHRILISSALQAGSVRASVSKPRQMQPHEGSGEVWRLEPGCFSSCCQQGERLKAPKHTRQDPGTWSPTRQQQTCLKPRGQEEAQRAELAVSLQGILKTPRPPLSPGPLLSGAIPSPC